MGASRLAKTRVTIQRRLSRRWMVLVAVVVVAIAGFAVYRLNGIFGAPGTVSTITYLDVNAQPERVDDATLPWAYDTTTQPAVFVNVSAQGDSDSIGCRIKIDDDVNAYAYCLDKSG